MAYVRQPNPDELRKDIALALHRLAWEVLDGTFTHGSLFFQRTELVDGGVDVSFQATRVVPLDRGTLFGGDEP